MRHIVDELKLFSSGCIILGGDYNAPLNPLMDTSTGTLCVRFRVLKKMKDLLRSLMLVDVWRMVHPDFTCYFTPHNKYSRIDYIFVTQRDLTDLRGASIGIQSKSDHAPVSMLLQLLNNKRCLICI